MLTLLFLLPILVRGDPLNHICFTPTLSTVDSTSFISNLKYLLTTLNTKVPQTGFGSGVVGQGLNRVTGLGLCRGDIASQNCKSCLTDANDELLERCSNQKGGIIWYDNCLVKYSNLDFFGKVDSGNRIYMCNAEDVSYPGVFNQKAVDLLSSLAKDAVRSQNLYAVGEIEFQDSKKLHGLVQCTRDLSGSGCTKCLDDAISAQSNCDGKRGARMVSGSCVFRYEIYSFVNE